MEFWMSNFFSETLGKDDRRKTKRQKTMRRQAQAIADWQAPLDFERSSQNLEVWDGLTEKRADPFQSIGQGDSRHLISLSDRN